MAPLIEKKPKPDHRSRKQSYAFYLSRGLVEDIKKIAHDTGRSKSEVLELLAKAGLDIHHKQK
ncbi:MAG: hypothetical protein HN337_06165 [Deltaproteobacteria bacterium]|nr:hypothetical protein [Deltaproteobacteria bacterium]